VSLLANGSVDFTLRILDEDLAKTRGAQCLDHSPAGYYIREQDPQKWVIFLEGGGLCVTPIDCIKRRYSHLGSSKYLHPDHLPEGESTCSRSEYNPFATFSHVWIPYCSGDTWLGNSAEGHLSLLGMQMSGHLILETIVDTLLNDTSMGSATDVVLSGSSAGGIGTYHHTDWFADVVASRAKAKGRTSPRVVGLPIEGMFFPKNFPVLFEQFVIGNLHPISNFMSKYLSLLQDPWLHPACVEAAHSRGFPPADCFSVATMISHSKTPLFICQNRFDSLEIDQVGLCNCEADSAPSSRCGRFIRFYGALQNETALEIKKALPETGLVMPSEFDHDANFYRFFSHTEKFIENTSVKTAFDSWYWNKRSVMLIEPTCNSNGPCTAPVKPLLSDAIVV